MNVSIEEEKKKYGKLHPSGLNRQQRRQQEMLDRRAYMIGRKKKADKVQEKVGKQIQARVDKQQSAAHEKALIRKGKKA